MNVIIQGNGLAALCCARLLHQGGHRVALVGRQRSRLPAIMLSERTLKLLRDLFADPDLFRTAPRIRRRTVAWGDKASPSTLDHSAVVVSEKVLLDTLSAATEVNDIPADQADWTIISAQPLSPGAIEQSIGSRTAFATQVNLAHSVPAEECSIESTSNGWLFLIPNTPMSGWLLSVGDKPESLLASSRVIAPRIAEIIDAGREFLACPRLSYPVCGDDWIACGSAAVSFDPICGDGTAYAAREAILAAAVIQATAADAVPKDLLAHYRDRVTGGFARHLALCLDLYRSGPDGRWWRTQVQSLEDGLRWCSEKLPPQPSVNFQLDGFTLTRVSRNHF
jgi:hypothetical protein